MAYKVSIKEHQSFIKARVQDKQAVADFNWFLVRAHLTNERKHCISVGHHYDKLSGNVCFFCGGER